jgi:predicted HTH domain antitoxin
VLLETSLPQADFEREAKLLLAAKLFEMGRLSSGKAAELSGMGRVEFLMSLQRVGVSMSNLRRRMVPTRSPLPNAPEHLVIDTGPLIALGKIDAFELIEQLPIHFATPRQVAGELEAGARLGHPVVVPPWVAIHDLSSEVIPLGQHVLETRKSMHLNIMLCRIMYGGHGIRRPT